MELTNKCLAMIGILGLLSMTACSHFKSKSTEESQPKVAANDIIAAEQAMNQKKEEKKAYKSVEIQFHLGSAKLTDNARFMLNTALEQARETGSIDKVMVLSWSDSDYPSKGVKKLSGSQRELAQKRNVAVEEFVKTKKSVDIETYNMAEKPNVFEKWFNTDDNKLKESLLSSGLPTTADAAPTSSKASRSIVLIKVE